MKLSGSRRREFIDARRAAEQLRCNRRQWSQRVAGKCAAADAADAADYCAASDVSLCLLSHFRRFSSMTAALELFLGARA